jgi:two-component system response regulator MprA
MHTEHGSVRDTIHGLDSLRSSTVVSNEFAVDEVPLVLILISADRRERLFIQALIRSGLRTRLTSSLEQSIKQLDLCAPDLVVFDADIGVEPLRCTIRHLRERGVAAPFLVVGVESATAHIVPLLAAGCDAFLEMSTCPEIVAAEASALIRRYRYPLGVARFGDLRLDPGSRVVTHCGIRIRLTPREYSLLHVLIRCAGRTVSTPELAVQIWGDVKSRRDVCKQLVRSLRRKIEGNGVIALENVRGQGYRLAQSVVSRHGDPATSPPSSLLL